MSTCFFYNQGNTFILWGGEIQAARADIAPSVSSSHGLLVPLTRVLPGAVCAVLDAARPGPAVRPLPAVPEGPRARAGEAGTYLPERKGGEQAMLQTWCLIGFTVWSKTFFWIYPACRLERKETRFVQCPFRTSPWSWTRARWSTAWGRPSGRAGCCPSPGFPTSRS